VKPRGVEPPQFRQLLGRFATGVTVVTSRAANGEPIGMTANSLASVSLDPPLVLVSVEHRHEMHAAMEKGTHFVFNILSSEQEACPGGLRLRSPTDFAASAIARTSTGSSCWRASWRTSNARSKRRSLVATTRSSSVWSSVATPPIGGLFCTTEEGTRA